MVGNGLGTQYIDICKIYIQKPQGLYTLHKHCYRVSSRFSFLMIVAALDCPMNDPLWIMACYDDVAPLTADGVLLQTLVITVVVTFVFLLSKTTYDNYRKRSSKATLVVVGAGPIGLTSLIIAAKSGKISRAILFEEKCSQDLVNRPQQIALEHKNVIFL